MHKYLQKLRAQLEENENRGCTSKWTVHIFFLVPSFGLPEQVEQVDRPFPFYLFLRQGFGLPEGYVTALDDDVSRHKNLCY
jgi:hypothetical protein